MAKFEFKFAGPFPVFTKKGSHGYQRVSSKQQALWKQIKDDLNLDQSMTKNKGIYIFTNSNMTPLYVGKTASSYGGECFTEHKRLLLNDHLRVNGTKDHQVIKICFIYTLAKPQKKSDMIRLSEKIDEMETHYILKGIEANTNGLLNTRKINRSWDCDELKKIFKKGRRQRD